MGVTQRGKKVRAGVDRWHYADGTIRIRLREQQTQDPPPREDGQHPPANTSVSFYNTAGWPKPAADNEELKGEALDTSSTSVGSDNTMALAQSSDSSGSEVVGFWKAGEWMARERTVQEQRLHRGGMGPQKTQRRAARVSSYLAGTWKPAWLNDYIRDKKDREEQAQYEVHTSTTPVNQPSSTCTDVDPWSSRTTSNSDSWWWSSWDSSSSWSSWTWSTSTTTSMADLEFLPNFGLFPDVREATPPAGVVMDPTMELTNSERAMLREAGMPGREVDRLAHLFTSLDSHETSGTGAEARWALGRLSGRADDGVQCLECLLNIIQRRLRPRGHWPVTRVPRSQQARLRLFAWIRQFGSILVNSFEHQLQTPLQPVEDGDLAAVEDTDNVEIEAHRTVAAASSGDTAEHVNPPGEQQHPDEFDTQESSPPHSRSRSRSRELDTMTPITTAEALAMSDAPELQRALQGELLGIWRSPSPSSTSTTTTPDTIGDWCLELDTQAATSSVTSMTSCRRAPVATPSSSSSAPTSSSTCFGSSSSSSCSSSPVSSSMALLVVSSEYVGDSQEEGETFLQQMMPHNPWSQVGTTLAVFPFDDMLLTPLYNMVDDMLGLTSTTTTSTEPVTTLDSIRDTVNQQMILANPEDVIDVAHRLLASSRDLVRRQRLFIAALEEVLLWLPNPGGQVFNGRTIAQNIGDRVIEEAGYGDGRSLALRTLETSAPTVLLQPDLPADLGEVDAAVPNLGRSVVAGLRRRAWRRHMTHLYDQAGVEQPSSPSDGGLGLETETFTDLFLIQATTGQQARAPEGCEPFPLLPRRGQAYHRRRLHAPRPQPGLREAREGVRAEGRGRAVRSRGSTEPVSRGPSSEHLRESVSRGAVNQDAHEPASREPLRSERSRSRDA